MQQIRTVQARVTAESMHPSDARHMCVYTVQWCSAVQRCKVNVLRGKERRR